MQKPISQAGISHGASTTPVRSEPSVSNALLDSILHRADAHYARKDWQSARDSLGLAASIAPDNLQILKALGSLHFQLKDYHEACAVFKSAINQSQDDADLHLQLAMSQVQLAQNDKAESTLRRALALRPEDQTALKMLADCYRDQKLYRDAATVYGSLIERHPDQVGVLLSLAKCFFSLDDIDGAQAALEQVLIIDPSNETARENLALMGCSTTKKSSTQKIQVVETIDELKRYFNLQNDGALLEPDLDVVENDCELNSRKRRDAEVLCTIAANATTNVLELGTSHGRGAFKLASNLKTGLHCYTVNILPEQHDASGGKLVTHLIPKDAIGSYYRERGLNNVTQHFANTARWEIPADIKNLSLIFIDAAHDEENVYLDSKLVWDRLAPGGFIVWHDFSQFSNHFEWIAASMRGVERFRLEYGLSELPVVNLRNSWCGVMRKPSASENKSPAAQQFGKDAPIRIHVAQREDAIARSPKSLRYLIVYPQYSDDRRLEEDQLAMTIRSYGYDVESFGLPCPGGWWHFPKLDEKWRSRSPDLMSMYEKLEEKLRNRDVLIASGGCMLHPEFVRQLSTFNVFVCADDPESSEILSRPAAPAFDYAFPINIACVDDYRRWGCERVDWLFAPVRPELCAPELTENAILHGVRDLDITLLCERVFNLSDRAQRIERLVDTFPNAFVRGPGWPGGAVEAPPIYRRAKIGWNLHNSSGPCNSRTTMLPAFGVLEICDNKSNLGKMFALDREVVGFDSIEECIEKTRYYLAHDAERRVIAAAGWKRVHRDYTLDRWWDKLVKTIFPAVLEKLPPLPNFSSPAILQTVSPATRLTPAQVIESVLVKGITYCATGEKLKHIAEAVGRVVSRRVPGIYLEAGVALGGSASVIASAKPRNAVLKLFDVFDMLPAPGEKDEPRAHEVYQQFIAGQRNDPIDLTYLAGIRTGMLETVRKNLADHGIHGDTDHVELIKGKFQDTLFIQESVAFVHIDCDWYDSIKLCIDRLVEYISPGGILVFDDYKSFSGAKQVIDEWLARDSRFRLTQSADNVIVERLPNVPTAAAAETEPELPVLTPEGEKPRVLMLVDRRGWAYDTAAMAIAKQLADEFEFRIEYVRENPDLNAWKFDLLYVFFWGETYHQKFLNEPRRIIKEISSHRWATEEAYGKLSAEAAAKRYLSDAGTLTATSRRLQSIFAPYREVHWCPNGFESDLFSPAKTRTGPLRIGWAGNRNDLCKGLIEVLEPAAKNNFELVIAGGDLDSQSMGNFYRSVDVLCVASTAEGEPLTLVEGMASGAFPVAVDVGIVPELVRHGEDGLIINRNPAAFQAAFQWCTQNIDRVRATGRTNARRLTSERRWEDVSIHWRRTLRGAYRGLAQSQTSTDATSGNYFERNLGVNLGRWPERAEAAAAAIAALPLESSGSLIDMGCGHQTLQPLIPAALTYVPVDRIARAPNVTVLDFNKNLPASHHTIATFLGVLEYFEDSPRLICWASQHVRYLVLSYNDCSNPVRREKQQWRSTLGFAELEKTIQRAGGRILKRQDLGRAELLYVAEFPKQPIAPSSVEISANARSAKISSKTLALFSAAVNGDNSGDALIADSTQRLLGSSTCKVFPLLQPLSPAQIEEVNSCDLGVICGTNLYQHVFACSLTPAIINQLRIPILPLGIGASAPIGGRPTMDAEGVRAVRMIHERCTMASVRDPVSLDFVRSLGISNVKLTGCPVLFHGLTTPRFETPSTERLFLSVRARLLHVEEHWNKKQLTTLRRICRDLRPTLVLQSPYDIPIAEDLVREFGLESRQADNWDAAHMINSVAQATRVVGFRLHFGMLALSHGKPSTFLATDTRTSGFCEMMGIPFHAVQTYRDEDLLAELSGPQPGMERFLTNWRALRSEMASLLEANGLNHALSPSA